MKQKIAQAFESQKLSAISQLATQLQREGCTRTEALIAADQLYRKADPSLAAPIKRRLRAPVEGENHGT